MNNQDDYHSSQRLLSKHNLRVISNVLLFALSYHLLLAPNSALALEEIKQSDNNNVAVAADNSSDTLDVEVEDEPEPVKEQFIVTSLGIKNVSAYNVGDPNQCDASPCTAANGENICLALELGYPRCAANFVPFGTILEIEGYGRCMVTDRMNSRYKNHVDIAMKRTERQTALQFGRQSLKISIVKKVEQI